MNNDTLKKYLNKKVKVCTNYDLIKTGTLSRHKTLKQIYLLHNDISHTTYLIKNKDITKVTLCSKNK